MYAFHTVNLRINSKLSHIKGALMNIGQRKLSDNALVKFGLAPAAGGGMIGTGYGINEKVNNPYADHNAITKGAVMGALAGTAIGGLSATTFRSYRDHEVKQSVYTNAQKFVLG